MIKRFITSIVIFAAGFALCAFIERFSIAYIQAYPRVPRVPRGLASSEFNSRLG